MTILVIDVGSSSVRALLMNAGGQLIPGTLARREHSFTEQATADAFYLRELTEACIDEVLLHAAAESIRAVGMATFVGNLLGIDHRNRPITPLYTYADVRSSTDATVLSQAYDLAEAHAWTGCRIHPAYNPAKLHWLKRTQPESYRQVAKWVDFATYCYTTWFGRAVSCSYSVASWSGLLNRHELTWDKTWLEALALDPSYFPDLADYSDVYQGLQAEYTERWPVLKELPFYLAVGDGAAANIGSGGIASNKPVLTIGTTAAIRIVTESSDKVSTGLWAYRVDTTHHLIGGATSEGGNVFVWGRDTLRVDVETLDEMLLKREPGSHGLQALPLFAGERSPGYYAEATGVITGLKLSSAPLDILHALLEGVALQLRQIYDLMARPGEAILASGGALTSAKAWRQILADILSVPLHMVDEPEATARGVALLANAGSEFNLPSDVPISDVVSPRAEIAEQVNEILARHKALYAQFIDNQSIH